MEYKVIAGEFRQGKIYLWEDKKVSKEKEVMDEVNRFLAKGWKLLGSPRNASSGDVCGTSILYHLVKDDG